MEPDVEAIIAQMIDQEIVAIPLTKDEHTVPAGRLCYPGNRLITPRQDCFLSHCGHYDSSEPNKYRLWGGLARYEDLPDVSSFSPDKVIALPTFISVLSLNLLQATGAIMPPSRPIDIEVGRKNAESGILYQIQLLLPSMKKV